MKKLMMAMVLMCVAAVGMAADDGNNKIYYTTRDGFMCTPYSLDGFGAHLLSNSYEDGVGVLYFDGDVTAIGENAFYECGIITSITLPSTVKTIGMSAFAWCTGLKSIEFPVGVTSIGNNALQACTALTAVTIPNTVETIGANALSGCLALKALSIPQSVVTIGSYGLSCDSIASLTWDSEVNPHCVTQYCKANLKEVTIGSHVTSIGNKAFFECGLLTSVDIPDNVASIGSEAFSKCTNLASVKMGKGVTSIGINAFNNCGSLSAVAFSENLETIGNYAFLNCGSLSEVTIPGKVASLGNYAFAYCKGLKSVDLPASLTTLGSYTFFQCTALESVACWATTPPTCGVSCFYNLPSAATLIVSKGRMAAYMNNTTDADGHGWKGFANMTEADNEEEVLKQHDVNGDGTVNATDVMNIYNLILSTDATDDKSRDVNGDGKVNATDVMMIYNYILSH